VPLIHKTLTMLRISAGLRNRPNENEQTKQSKIMQPLNLVKWSQIFHAYWYTLGFTFANAHANRKYLIYFVGYIFYRIQIVMRYIIQVSRRLHWRCRLQVT